MGLYDTRETAAFNLALPYLTRVNNILNANYTEFKNGNSPAFAMNLHQLYRELYPWLLENPKKNQTEVSSMKKLFTELANVNKKNKEAVWDKLEQIEMTMRIHFKQLGMLMPKIQDPRFLFGNKQR